MTKNAATYDKISGHFFLAGFVLYKLKNVPNLFLASLFNLAALSAYLVGYVTWFLASLCYPDHPRKRDSWYGFAEFKDQFQVASLLGIAATVMCLVYPTLVLPALWLFTISNIVWCVAEYHKQHNPPEYDANYSNARQSIYIRYALLVTASSAITAIGVSVSLSLPALAYTALLVSSIVGGIVTIAAFYHFKQAIFDHFPPDVIDHSYQGMATDLSFDLNQAPQHESRPEVLAVRAQQEVAELARRTTVVLPDLELGQQGYTPCL